MARKRRLLVDGDEHDPLSSLTNLFDVAMVFAVALMVALVTRFDMTEVFSQQDYTMVKNPGTEQMEIITKKGDKIEKYTPSENQESDNSSRGKRVGAAYQLKMERLYMCQNKFRWIGIAAFFIVLLCMLLGPAVMMYARTEMNISLFTPVLPKLE